MPDTLSPIFTHFSSTGAELPGQYYTAVGRALYRWSQLEATVCALAEPLRISVIRTIRFVQPTSRHHLFFV
jgi:hypothetical protein